MKKKRKKIISVGIVLLVILVVLLIIYAMTKKTEESKGITFYLSRSTMPASNWTYELSNNNVLKEVDDSIYDCFYDRYDYWEFRSIAGVNGEVTIHFIAQHHLEIVEEDCFSITYYVDENGNVTEISSENKPDKVNFDDDIAGLVWLKTVDFLTKYIDRKISFIVDGEFMRLFR